MIHGLDSVIVRLLVLLLVLLLRLLELLLRLLAIALRARLRQLLLRVLYGLAVLLKLFNVGTRGVAGQFGCGVRVSRGRGRGRVGRVAVGIGGRCGSGLDVGGFGDVMAFVVGVLGWQVLALSESGRRDPDVLISCAITAPPMAPRAAPPKPAAIKPPLPSFSSFFL